MKTDKEIIEKTLAFLVTDFNFEFEYRTTNGNEEFYSYKNRYGSFNYYQWAHFGEYRFSVMNSNGIQDIRFNELYPNIVAQFNKDHKGLKWLFKDSREDYWNMIASILRLEINKNNSLFGLKPVAPAII